MKPSAKIVVADSGPLIALARLGLLELLPKLFGDVLVPQTVVDECLASTKHPDGPPIREAVANGWLSPVADPALLPSWNLDAGETCAIAVALAQVAGVVMDDQAGRRVATQLGLSVIGTAGILVLAKRAHLIKAVGPLLTALRDSGYFLGKDLMVHVLRVTGEE